MAGGAIDIDRERVVAYRIAAHELDRSVADPSTLAVVDLGVQDTPYGSARLALAARLAEPDSTNPGGGGADDRELTLVWSVRGAPHLHRPADLPRLAEALWPHSDADATARLPYTPIKEGARLGVAAFTAAARALHDVVRAPMPKGEVSTAVSARVPASLTYWCEPCGAQHISGGLFQQVGLPAGVRVIPTGPGTTLAPIDGWPGVPTESAGAGSVASAYLRLLGPATPADVAKFLGTSVAELRRCWPDDLVEVRVDGRRGWLPADRVGALRSAPAPRLVRLLPPADPFLQGRDRALLVPDKDRQSAVWSSIGKPGALLVDGEIAGTWRARAAGRDTLDVTVTAFEPPGPKTRAAIETEAGHVAAARGVRNVRVRI
jgi:Winged helix DNA-binding domain